MLDYYDQILLAIAAVILDAYLVSNTPGIQTGRIRSVQYWYGTSYQCHYP